MFYPKIYCETFKSINISFLWLGAKVKHIEFRDLYIEEFLILIGNIKKLFAFYILVGCN